MIDPDVLIDDPEVMLGYMRAKHKGVFHNSNIFFRDLQYSVRDYFEDMEGKTITIPQAEQIAKDIARSYETLGIFKRVNPQGYVLNYPELVTPKTGTNGVMSNDRTVVLPPMRGTPAAALIAAEAAMNAAPVKAAPAKAAAAPKAAAPAVASDAGASAPKPAAAPSGAAPAGGLPAGAKTTPPWLKK